MSRTTHPRRPAGILLEKIIRRLDSPDHRSGRYRREEEEWTGMTRKITPAEIAAWRERWRLVEERQVEELRRQSVEEKFRELVGLMAAAERFGWEGRPEEERALVRRRWLRIYRAYGFGKEDA